MHAFFTIEHDRGDLFSLLPETFGPRSQDALERSLLLQRVSDKARYYASEQPFYLIFGWRAGARTLQLIVEPTAPVDLRRACETVWRDLREHGRDMAPSLKSVTLEDQATGYTLAEAVTGLGPQVRRPELLCTGVVALLSAIWLAIALPVFGASGDLVLGAIPALGAGVVAVALVLVDSRQKKLVWS